MKSGIRLLILLVVLFSGPIVKGQSYHYRILAHDDEVGNMVVRKSIKDSITHYTVEAHSTVHILFSESLEYSLHSIFYGKLMNHSTATIFVNGNEHFKSIVERQENGFYKILKRGEELPFLQPIYYSGAKLYFEEPKGISIIFSEIDNVLKNITALGNHQYKIVNPVTGKASLFWYKDGILQKAQIDHTYVSFSIELVEN